MEGGGEEREVWHGGRLRQVGNIAACIWTPEGPRPANFGYVVREGGSLCFIGGRVSTIDSETLVPA